MEDGQDYKPSSEPAKETVSPKVTAEDLVNSRYSLEILLGNDWKE
jgi:hypothetical protein